MVRVTNGIERDGETSKDIEGQRMMAHSAGGRSWKELERTGNREPQPGVVGPAGNAEGSRGAGSNGLLHHRPVPPSPKFPVSHSLPLGYQDQRSLLPFHFRFPFFLT